MDGAPDFTRAFLRLPRAVLRELWPDETDLRVYLELLDRAAFQAGPRMVAGRVVTLAVGQCVAGRAELAARCGTSEQTIRTSLNHLQTLRLITIESTSRGSVVTVCGYAESSSTARSDQPADPPADQPASSPAINQQPTSPPTTNEDLRSENQDLKPEREPARAPAGFAEKLGESAKTPVASAPPPAFDPSAPLAIGRLAEATWRRISDAATAVAAELRLPAPLPFPDITPSTQRRGFVELKDRIREEGALAPTVCDAVVQNLVKQARAKRSVEWLAEKAFGDKAWLNARNGVDPSARVASGQRTAPSPAPRPPIDRRPPDPELTDEERAELAELANRLAVSPAAGIEYEQARGRAPSGRRSHQADDQHHDGAVS
jgi:hypothetical protein